MVLPSLGVSELSVHPSLSRRQRGLAASWEHMHGHTHVGAWALHPKRLCGKPRFTSRWWKVGENRHMHEAGEVGCSRHTCTEEGEKKKRGGGSLYF